MFETYLATEQDLKTIEEALRFVKRKELNFIFRNRHKIAKTLVISYDSKQVYIWEKRKNKYSLQKIPHNLKIKDKCQLGWRARLKPSEIEPLLPIRWRVDRFKRPKISGGLLAPFVMLQKKKKKRRLNPYTTYESYLATIVHEFGHVYYDQHKLWWYSNKKENLNYLEKAQKLYQKKRVDLKNLKFHIPVPSYLSELFAFCTDYTAASIFWPKHKEDLNKYFSARISELRIKEKDQNLNIQDSVLDENPHTFAAIMGRLLFERYPKKWPEILLQGHFL